jgi:hypothetical protein
MSNNIKMMPNLACFAGIPAKTYDVKEFELVKVQFLDKKCQSFAIYFFIFFYYQEIELYHSFIHRRSNFSFCSNGESPISPNVTM